MLRHEFLTRCTCAAISILYQARPTRVARTGAGGRDADGRDKGSPNPNGDLQSPLLDTG